MHELSKLTNIPYASFYRVVQGMGDILNVETVGKAKTLCLKTENPVLKAHLTVSSDEERKEFLEKHPTLRKKLIQSLLHGKNLRKCLKTKMKTLESRH